MFSYLKLGSKWIRKLHRLKLNYCKEVCIGEHITHICTSDIVTFETDICNWYLTLLIKLKLVLVNFGTLNHWFWAQFTLTLLKFDISDLQNYWHLQLLIFGIISISCFLFLELFTFSMSDIKHDCYRTWLTFAYLILWIFGIERYQKLGMVVIIYYWFIIP